MRGDRLKKEEKPEVVNTEIEIIVSRITKRVRYHHQPDGNVLRRYGKSIHLNVQNVILR